MTKSKANQYKRREEQESMTNNNKANRDMIPRMSLAEQKRRQRNIGRKSRGA